MDSIEQREEQKVVNVKRRENWNLFTPERIEKLLNQNIDPAIGYLIWVKPSLGKEQVSEHIAALQSRGIRHLRTGISWAEWRNPEEKERIKEYIRQYAAHLQILPCLTFTPPELGIKPMVNSPPKDPGAYGLFVEEVILELGDCLEEVELWNEWNLETDWDDSVDPEYEIFIKMIREGAMAAHAHGKRVVLGGASRVSDKSTSILSRFSRTLADSIDVIGFHNLRGTWSDKFPHESLVEQKKSVWQAWGKNVPVYLTEYGFPVVDPENRFDLSRFEDIQVALFAYAVYASLAGAVDKVYWYTYKDHVIPSLRFATTGWEDVLQHYFGDTHEDGTPRKLGRLLMEGGPKHVLRYAVQNNMMPLVDEASLGRILSSSSVA